MPQHEAGMTRAAAFLKTFAHSVKVVYKPFGVLLLHVLTTPPFII